MLFETRYFWAVFTSRDAAATSKLKRLYEKSRSTCASSISAYEVYKQSVANEGKAVARLRVDTIVRDFNIIDVDSATAEEGAEMSHGLRIPMADSLVMATAKRHSLPCVTDGPHFTEVKRAWV